MLETEPRDPSRYLHFYSEMSGYRFIPQSELDSFCEMVEGNLNRLLQDNISKHEAAISKFGPDAIREEFAQVTSIKERIRSICMPEEAATECIVKLQLLDELRFISIYRSIEIARAEYLIESLDWIIPENCYKISYLRKEIPFWSKVFGADEIDEIRVINNCIKHSGKVSRQLAQMHPSWQEGQPFHEYRNFGSLRQPMRPLRDAYERLAPNVGAYWNHFCELCKPHSRKKEKQAEELWTEEYLLDLIRSGKGIESLLDEDH